MNHTGTDHATLDPRELRKAFGRFATGVCLVTTRCPDGSVAGLTVNSFSSVSLDPPLVAWCLAKKAPSLPVFMKTEHYAVHVMAAGQQEIAMNFARPAEDKFAPVRDAFLNGTHDIPVLKDALAHFHCRKSSVVDAGDHLIFIGQVETFRYVEDKPLLFYAGTFVEAGAA